MFSYKACESFIPEQFWRVRVLHKQSDVQTEFAWNRVRLFLREPVEVRII